MSGPYFLSHLAYLPEFSTFPNAHVPAGSSLLFMVQTLHWRLALLGGDAALPAAVAAGAERPGALPAPRGPPAGARGRPAPPAAPRRPEPEGAARLRRRRSGPGTASPRRPRARAAARPAGSGARPPRPPPGAARGRRFALVRPARAPLRPPAVRAPRARLPAPGPELLGARTARRPRFPPGDGAAGRTPPARPRVRGAGRRGRAEEGRGGRGVLGFRQRRPPGRGCWSPCWSSSGSEGRVRDRPPGRAPSSGRKVGRSLGARSLAL